MALSNALGVVVSGSTPFPGSGVVSNGAASRISVVKSRLTYNGSAIPDSAVRSLTHNLRIAYPSVEGNITDV